MASEFYTVCVHCSNIEVTRETYRWRIGKINRSGHPRFFSKKVDLFLDKEDIQKISFDAGPIGSFQVSVKPGKVLCVRDQEIAYLNNADTLCFRKEAHKLFREDRNFLKRLILSNGTIPSGVLDKSDLPEDSIFQTEKT